MDKDFFSAVAGRRTYYGLSKESAVSDERIQEIIEHALKHTPTAFNSQGARVVILFGPQHDRLWDIAKEALRKVVPVDQFITTEDKINGFKNAFGTVLFFEDSSLIESLQKQFELYKDNFPVWAQQSNGMLQYVVWTGLHTEGLGASLQHYNELIETDVKNEWSIPSNWKLIAQMPFGKQTSEAGNKQIEPLEQRIKIFK